MTSALPWQPAAFTYVRRSFVDGTDVRPDERQLYRKVCKDDDPLWKFGIDRIDVTG